MTPERDSLHTTRQRPAPTRRDDGRADTQQRPLSTALQRITTKPETRQHEPGRGLGKTRVRAPPPPPTARLPIVRSPCTPCTAYRMVARSSDRATAACTGGRGQEQRQRAPGSAARRVPDGGEDVGEPEEHEHHRGHRREHARSAELAAQHSAPCKDDGERGDGTH